jgi:two-component system nitrate/nitrite response regulator NarL
MSRDIVHNEQIHPVARNASSYVTTVLVCQNNLILSGTDFLITVEATEQASERPILCLIHADQEAKELAETIERLKAQWPSARVVVLTDHMEPAALVQAVRAGLGGLCSTAMDREPLIKALELVMLGETFISPAIVQSLLSEAPSHQQATPDGTSMLMSATDPTAAAITNKLSNREVQILQCLTQGGSNKHIARELGVAEATVKVHVKAILRKVKASNRTQAAMWAQQHMSPAAHD